MPVPAAFPKGGEALLATRPGLVEVPADEIGSPVLGRGAASS
ncbi:MAG: hypothetical protein ABSH47_26755 [Bryobacteraceae bacterium]